MDEDWDGQDLRSLVARVDHDEAKAVFHRGRRRRRRRAVLVRCAVVAVLVGVGVGTAHAMAGSDTAVTSGPTDPDTTDPGGGLGEVVVQVEHAPLFTEGFDLAIRFRSVDGTVLAERRLAEFDRVGERSWSTSVFLSRGPVIVDSHLTIGAGPGPIRPDFVIASPDPPCLDMSLDVERRPVVLVLAWGTGCLTADVPADPASSPLLPDRAADARGMIVATPSPDVIALNSDERYYRGTELQGLNQAVLIDGTTGERVHLADLVPGRRVEVWFGACTGSPPLRCEVTALRSRP